YLTAGQIIALVDLGAPNLRVVRVCSKVGANPEFIDIVPESHLSISNLMVVGDRLFVSYMRQSKTEIRIFDFAGHARGEIPVKESGTVRLRGGSPSDDELLLERESFFEPIRYHRYSIKTGKETPWKYPQSGPDASNYIRENASYPSKDGTQIPMAII